MDLAVTDGSMSLIILVVEDLDDAAQSTAELLTLCGHKVQVAGCGDDALRAVTSEVPDVVLLDIGLPDMDGWEVARRLRDQVTGKQPFVVAITGYGSDGDRWQSADAGIDLHLVKPVDPGDLTSLMAWIQRVLVGECAENV